MRSIDFEYGHENATKFSYEQKTIRKSFAINSHKNKNHSFFFVLFLFMLAFRRGIMGM